MAIAVGIDLAFRHTGVVAAEIAPSNANGYDPKEAKCYVTDGEAKKRGVYVAQDDIAQCQKMTSEVLSFIGYWNPKMLAVEAPAAGAKGARAMRAMGIATGMIAAITHFTHLPVVWVMPRDSKILIAGKANASKDEMMAGILSRFTQGPWPKQKGQFEHIADAMAALLVARSSDLYKLLSQPPGA